MGQGINPVGEIAEATLQRQFWKLLTRRKSVWIDWAYSKYIKDKIFWSLKIQITYSLDAPTATTHGRPSVWNLASLL